MPTTRSRGRGRSMLTEVGRAEAHRRAAFLEQTLAALSTELAEPLP